MARSAYSSDLLFLAIVGLALRMAITLSRGDSVFDELPVRRCPRQKPLLSAFIAHWTAASRICLGSYDVTSCEEQ